MGIKCTTDKSNVDKILKNLKELSEKKIQVGILAEEDSQLLKIAAAQEFGAHITPKNGKYLSIPLSHKYKDVSPRSVEGLFVFKSKKGNLFLAKAKGKKKKDIDLCYWLTKEINIPERSFIRAGFDENKDDIEAKANDLLASLVTGDYELNAFLDFLGQCASGKIKSYLVDLNSPGNSPLTAKVKRSSNPLVDSGRLRDAIDYKVVKG